MRKTTRLSVISGNAPVNVSEAAKLYVTQCQSRNLSINTVKLNRHVLNCAEKAGVTHPHMGPHLLRHTSAVSYLRAGGDVFSLQKILGHSDLKMTRRYSELADSDVQEKHRQFSPADRLNNANPTNRKRLA